MDLSKVSYLVGYYLFLSHEWKCDIKEFVTVRGSLLKNHECAQ